MSKYYTYGEPYQKENARSLETKGVINGCTIPDIIQRLADWGKSWLDDMCSEAFKVGICSFLGLLLVVYGLALAKSAGWY